MKRGKRAFNYNALTLTFRSLRPARLSRSSEVFRQDSAYTHQKTPLRKIALPRSVESPRAVGGLMVDLGALEKLFRAKACKFIRPGNVRSCLTAADGDDRFRAGCRSAAQLAGLDGAGIRLDGFQGVAPFCSAGNLVLAQPRGRHWLGCRASSRRHGDQRMRAYVDPSVRPPTPGLG